MRYGILLYALVAVLIGATDALDGIDTQQGPLTLDSNCARMNLVDVLYRCVTCHKTVPSALFFYRLGGLHTIAWQVLGPAAKWTLSNADLSTCERDLHGCQVMRNAAGVRGAG